eukprot:TRINITY_DN1867_c0_g1_i18.p2 TRINITY_DN1867_c0_g1~~TRINITY_DN1867_c0_g1_i18.p2  ORF type:complete len:286 (-),score=-19.35 TRINITY_DN1867_c0_g1_i18:18-875(-)
MHWSENNLWLRWCIQISEIEYFIIVCCTLKYLQILWYTVNILYIKVIQSKNQYILKQFFVQEVVKWKIQNMQLINSMYFLLYCILAHEVDLTRVCITTKLYLTVIICQISLLLIKIFIYLKLQGRLEPIGRALISKTIRNLIQLKENNYCKSNTNQLQLLRYFFNYQEHSISYNYYWHKKQIKIIKKYVVSRSKSYPSYLNSIFSIVSTLLRIWQFIMHAYTYVYPCIIDMVNCNRNQQFGRLFYSSLCGDSKPLYSQSQKKQKEDKGNKRKNRHKKKNKKEEKR